MGTWAAGIYSNDTAQDLRSEYTSAFWYYDVPTALEKIDSYVRTMFDESDEEEWCSYFYSLADFMWKKGILTKEIRDRAAEMIDSGFGLELWREEGDKALRERQKVLEKFRTQILSPLPPKKRIKPSVHTEDPYADGDVFAVPFQTKGKPYTCGSIYAMTQEAFEALDGKYFLVQKIRTDISWRSAIVPEVADHWLIFRLFAGTYDTPPVLTDCTALKPVPIWGSYRHSQTPGFITESSSFYFKRRKAVFLTNDKASCTAAPAGLGQEDIYFGINKPWYNPDSKLAASLLYGSESVV